jgi:hypothetical protein
MSFTASITSLVKLRLARARGCVGRYYMSFTASKTSLIVLLPLLAGLGKRLVWVITLSVTFLPGEALSKQHNTKSALLQEGYMLV